MDDIKSLLLPAAAHFNRQYRNQKIGGALEAAENPAADKTDPKLRAACSEMESLLSIIYLKKCALRLINPALSAAVGPKKFLPPCWMLNCHAK